MHKTFFFLFISSSIALTSIISSCNHESKEKFIDRFENFIADIDSTSKNYSKADWEIADEEFVDLKDNQLTLWEDLLTPPEKDHINEMIGKYQAIQLKQEIHNVKDEVKDIINQTKSVFNELSKDTSLIK